MDTALIREKVRFSPDGPVKVAIADTDGRRCLLFCLEQGQSTGLSRAEGTVALLVVEGEGFFMGDNDAEEGVVTGRLALYDSEETYGMKATGRFVVLAVLS